MTDRTPTTEAGRRLLEMPADIYDNAAYMESSEYVDSEKLRPFILAIEDEARAPLVELARDVTVASTHADQQRAIDNLRTFLSREDRP
jgi:hypothetical protein